MNKRLIILGNGFDLSCGLKSKYIDFFKYRLQNLFETTDFDKIRDKLEEHETTEEDLTFPRSLKGKKYIQTQLEDNLKNSSCYQENTDDKNKKEKMNQFTLNKNGGWKNYKSLTRWDVFFIYAQKYLKSNINEWQDIENIINNVVTIALTKKNDLKKVELKTVKTNLHYEENGEDKFKKIIYKYSGTANSSPEEIAHLLLFDLINFETEFSKYIYLQLDLKNDKKGHFDLPYFINAEELLKEIIKIDDIRTSTELSVISFNYTLGPRFKSKINDKLKNTFIKIETWMNIHGLSCYNDPNARAAIKPKGEIPAPIFGIDPEDVLNCKCPARIIFTKPYRLITNKIDNINQTINFHDINEVNIYGHSLGEADHSYFYYIFDQINIYDNAVKLLFFYCPGELVNGIIDLINQQEIERHFTEKVVKMLNNYGKRSKYAREDIVTKLALEGRLSILPNPKIYNFQKVES